MENQYYNNNDFNELDDLRQQITALKNKVDQQGCLNEEMVKKVIQDKMKSVHRTICKIAAMAIAVIPLYIMMKYEVGLSWPLVIFTIVMLLGFITFDFYINRMDINHMGDDLVETARKLTQMKKNRSISQKIGIALCIPWLAWFGYEFYQHNLSTFGSQTAIATFVPIGVGAIVGAVIGISIYRKMQRTNDEMIDQINELIHEE